MDITLPSWPRVAGKRLDANHAVFERLLGRSLACLDHGLHERSAVFAEIAAHHATWRHTGVFASPPLEAVLAALAERGVPRAPSRVGPARASAAASCVLPRVLHVASMVSGLAGLQQLVRRWIEIDASRCHSVAVSQWSAEPPPARLEQVVRRSGGRIEQIGNQCPDLLTRAERIRTLADDADLVVLHLQTEDAVPFLALAGSAQRPPVVLVNHADHAFWLGASLVDGVVNLRSSGLHLCHERRGVALERLFLLPTPLDAIERSLSREEAKDRLGLPRDAVVLLSVARAPKYVPNDALAFPIAHLDLLQRNPSCRLLAVGPPHDASWRIVSEASGGRARAYGPRADTALFFQAADVYLDAYPMPSVTSLLEAGRYGTPLVTRCAPSGLAAVWGADAPGLDRCLVRAPVLADYTAALTRLVTDPAWREALGTATEREIRRCHVGSNWAAVLERLYAAIAELEARRPYAPPPVQRARSELDLITPNLLHHGVALEQMLYRHKAALGFDPFVAGRLSRRPGLLLRAVASRVVARWRRMD